MESTFPRPSRALKESAVFLLLAAAMVLLGPMPGRAAARQTLHSRMPAAISHLTPMGRLASSQHLKLAISLPLRNSQALADLLRQVNDPSSPNYRHYLTPAQFAERFGPTEKDYSAVIAFAKSHGLAVTATHPNRTILDVDGAVPDIEKALHVTMWNYQHPTEARRFYAPSAEPSVDLSVPILGISGLDNYSLPRPRFKPSAIRPKGYQASPANGSGPYGLYMGKDFRKAYVPNVSLTGTGQTVGLVQFDGYTPGDITYYESAAGLPNVPLTNVLLDGFNGAPTGDGGEVEVSLDIEMAVSMAWGVSGIIVYEAGPNGNWYDVLNRIATDNLAKQVSCSWYSPGEPADPTADQIFQQMALQGQSFFSASGDSDAFTGLIPFPGDTPYITEVGGTTLNTASSGGAYISETVWNWGRDGSGGGISTQYPIPTWQQGISMTSNLGSITMRNVPDVALTADNVYVRVDNSDYGVGGTSCAAPLWAGFTALVNQQSMSNTGTTVGFINPAVYAIGQGAGYTSAFHDITTGNNFSSSSPTDFPAVVGYDLCTGWGTPNGTALINALAGSPAPVITNGPPPAATLNVAYSFAYTSGGYPAPTFSLAPDSSLPPELTLSSTGTISGTPTATGTFPVTVTAANGVSPNATQSFSMVVQQAPSITSGPPSPAAAVDTAYSFTFTFSGYPAPVFSLSPGSSLPPGLMLSSSGTISGTPNAMGTYTGTITASNAAGSATQGFTITVTAATTDTPTMPPWALAALAFLLVAVAAKVMPGPSIAPRSFAGDLRRGLAVGLVALALAQRVEAQEPAVPPAPVPAADAFYQLVNGTGGKFKDEDISWTVEGNVWHTLAEAKSLPPGQKHNGRVRFKLTDRATGETYEDFIEWAQNGHSWFGNTSQVDAFVIPLTIELFDASGQSSKVGINQSRSALFAEFKKEAPPEFQACVIGDKKIVSPHQADMGKGKPFADYFQKYIDDTWARYATASKTPDGWTGQVVGGALIYTPPDGGKGYTCKSKPTTEQALLGTGPLGASPQFCSAINRHVLGEPSAFADASKYYQALPYNFYAKFWHEHTVNGKAYGFCYDDFNKQDTLIHYANATKLVITLYWNTPPADSSPTR